MFAKYEYQVGATLANVMSDIVALLTGETNKANLSADCVQANTYIISTVAAGWTVYDAIAGTNAQCLRALDVGSSTYKYLVVDLNSTGRLLSKTYESWDSGAYTGTNLAYNSDNVDLGQIISLAEGGILFCRVSAKHGIFFSHATSIVRTPKTITAYGDAKVSTAQAQFGGASAIFDGTGDYLSIPDSADWAFGTNNFTVDCWVRFSASTNDQMIYAQGTNEINLQQLYMHFVDNTLHFVLNGGTTFDHSWAWTPSLNTWYHVALVRSGSSWYAFVNGSSLGTNTSSASIGDYTGAFIIGANYNVAVNFLNGYVDEFRVSNIARWTANFTSPSSAHLNDANTLLLIHADGTNGSTTFTDDARGLIYGSIVGNAPCGIFERSRAAGWDTVGAGYPPYVFLSGQFSEIDFSGSTAGTITSPRIKGLSGDLTGVNAQFNASTEFGSGGNSASTPIKSILPTGKGFNSSLVLNHFMHEIGLVNKANAYKAGKILDNIYLTTTDFGSAEDEIIFNGNTYFIMSCGQSSGTGAGGRIAVPKF